MERLALGLLISQFVCPTKTPKGCGSFGGTGKAKNPLPPVRFIWIWCAVTWAEASMLRVKRFWRVRIVREAIDEIVREPLGFWICALLRRILLTVVAVERELKKTRGVKVSIEFATKFVLIEGTVAGRPSKTISFAVYFQYLGWAVAENWMLLLAAKVFVRKRGVLAAPAWREPPMMRLLRRDAFAPNVAVL